MSHPVKLDKYPGTLEELAQEIENLRYDKLLDFINHLAMALHTRSVRDEKANRPLLANHLREAANKINGAWYRVHEAWKICKPHMEDQDGKES